jgi:formylglycine-generating enzyme required for sulfatase activity
MSATRLEPADLVRIPGGTFPMGQADGGADERPVHAVSVAPFLLCRFQATNAHYDAW